MERTVKANAGMHSGKKLKGEISEGYFSGTHRGEYFTMPVSFLVRTKAENIEAYINYLK